MSEAILATFSDFRTVKTRSTAQLVFEIPIDQADEALRLLGGIPQPGTERWAGIALAAMDRKGHIGQPEYKAEQAAKNKEFSGLVEAIDKQRRPFNTLPLSQQAAIRCQDKAFRVFLANQTGQDDFTVDQAAEDVRLRCDVESRSQILEGDISGSYWLSLEAEYQAHITDLRYGSGIK